MQACHNHRQIPFQNCRALRPHFTGTLVARVLCFELDLRFNIFYSRGGNARTRLAAVFDTTLANDFLELRRATGRYISRSVRTPPPHTTERQVPSRVQVAEPPSILPAAHGTFAAATSQQVATKI